jgi:hypothetical protein
MKIMVIEDDAPAPTLRAITSYDCPSSSVPMAASLQKTSYPNIGEPARPGARFPVQSNREYLPP